jgi:hypothetical protein
MAEQTTLPIPQLVYLRLPEHFSIKPLAKFLEASQTAPPPFSNTKTHNLKPYIDNPSLPAVLLKHS